MLGRPRRLALLAEGRFTPADARTAVGVLRHRPDEVAAVIDSSRAGRTRGERAGVGGIVAVDADDHVVHAGVQQGPQVGRVGEPAAVRDHADHREAHLVQRQRPAQAAVIGRGGP